MKNKKGFTLIELMIVVAIIGILAALAIPDFMKMMAKSKQSEAKTNLKAIFTAQTSYFGDKNEYGTLFSQIDWAPEGQNLYNYHNVDESVGARKGDVTVCTTAAIESAAIDARSFTNVATANIDNDDACDEWIVNDVNKIDPATGGDDVKN